MFGLFSEIIEILTNLPTYVMYALESFINLIFSAIEGALNLAVALLPELPEIITPPGYMEELNWFFPVGAVLAIAAPLLSAYIVFLGVRWLFNKIGEL